MTGEKERKHLDFELNKTSLPYHRLMFHTTVSREESVEMIVPDSCPDIAHLLDTSAICCLDTKEALEDTVSLAGRIYGRILYLADGSDALCSLPVALDFQCGVNQDGILPSCQVIALTRVRTAETKAVNSRKVLVRVQYEVSLRVYQPDLLTIPCGVAQGDGVEQRLESAEGYFVVAVPEKQFQFQDDLTLSGGQPAIGEVLRMQSDVTCTEAKLIGGKLVFKGEVSVRMLYRSVEEDVLTADFVLPYSQIMDAAEAAENADFQIEVALLGWTLGELDYDGRSIPIDLELYACAEVRQVETVSLLADAYSVRQEVTADYTPYTFPQLAERCVRRESKRELLETEEPDGTVLDLSTKTVHTTVTKGDGSLQVASVVEMTVLRVDDAGRVDALTRQVTVETELPVSGDVEVLVRSQVTDRSALPAANGLELRLGVAFQILLLRQTEQLGIAGLTAEENASMDAGERPSIVLRQMAAGETLWDIAKAYQTTVSEIQQANDMEDQPAEPGVLLLIPRMR